MLSMSPNSPQKYDEERTVDQRHLLPKYCTQRRSFKQVIRIADEKKKKTLGDDWLL